MGIAHRITRARAQPRQWPRKPTTGDYVLVVVRCPHGHSSAKLGMLQEHGVVAIDTTSPYALCNRCGLPYAPCYASSAQQPAHGL